MGHTMINLIVEIGVGVVIAYVIFGWLEKQGIIDRFRKKKKTKKNKKKKVKK